MFVYLRNLAPLSLSVLRHDVMPLDTADQVALGLKGSLGVFDLNGRLLLSTL